MLSTSPAARESHTPSIPKRRGRNSTGATMKTMVRQKDSMAEVLPLFSVAARRTPQNFIAQDLGIAAPAGAGADGKLIRNSSINQLVS